MTMNPTNLIDSSGGEVTLRWNEYSKVDLEFTVVDYANASPGPWTTTSGNYTHDLRINDGQASASNVRPGTLSASPFTLAFAISGTDLNVTMSITQTESRKIPRGTWYFTLACNSETVLYGPVEVIVSVLP